jgi:hypothetical protein
VRCRPESGRDTHGAVGKAESMSLTGRGGRVVGMTEVVVGHRSTVDDGGGSYR